jgi:hypothetical protein
MKQFHRKPTPEASNTASRYQFKVLTAHEGLLVRAETSGFSTAPVCCTRKICYKIGLTELGRPRTARCLNFVFGAVERT